MEMHLLDRLNSSELTLFAEHLKLGEGHLKAFLDEEEIHLLEKESGRKFSKLQTDKPEAAGKALLALNTAATGALGVLLGYTELLKISLSPPLLIGILGFSFLLGGWIGYQNFQITKSRANKAIGKQKINSLQMLILEKLHQKKSEELYQLQRELSSFIEKNLESEELLLSEVQKKIHRAAAQHQRSPLYPVFREEIEKAHALFDKLRENKGPAVSGIPPFLQGLLTSAPALSKRRVSWWRRSRKSLAVGLVPTLLGGLGFFLSLRGETSQIATAFGNTGVSAFLQSPPPGFYTFQLFFTLCTTAYFGYSFIHENWKAFIRDRAQEKLEEEIVAKESALTLLDAKVTKMRQAKEALHRMKMLFEALKKAQQGALA